MASHEDSTVISFFFRAVSGCQYVFHMASPIPLSAPRKDSDLIDPAVQGTIAVLKAARDAGCVKRVVLTSSLAAVMGK